MSEFSKTAIKEIRRQNKDQLVAMVIKISNYAEQQKAQNIILLKMVEELKAEIKKNTDPKQETEPS